MELAARPATLVRALRLEAAGRVSVQFPVAWRVAIVASQKDGTHVAMSELEYTIRILKKNPNQRTNSLSSANELKNTYFC